MVNGRTHLRGLPSVCELRPNDSPINLILDMNMRAGRQLVNGERPLFLAIDKQRSSRIVQKRLYTGIRWEESVHTEGPGGSTLVSHPLAMGGFSSKLSPSSSISKPKADPEVCCFNRYLEYSGSSLAQRGHFCHAYPPTNTLRFLLPRVRDPASISQTRVVLSDHFDMPE
jgi:hypothetical protein